MGDNLAKAARRENKLANTAEASGMYTHVTYITYRVLRKGVITQGQPLFFLQYYVCVSMKLWKGALSKAVGKVSTRRCVCVAGYVDRNNTLRTGKTFTRLRLHCYNFCFRSGNVFAFRVDVETLSYKESLQKQFLLLYIITIDL